MTDVKKPVEEQKASEKAPVSAPSTPEKPVATAAKPVVKAPTPPVVKLPVVKEKKGPQPLTEEILSGMNKHEIRAVAHDRGYQIGDGGAKALSKRFLQAQAEHKS